jgi:hypothetical protein
MAASTLTGEIMPEQCNALADLMEVQLSTLLPLQQIRTFQQMRI